MKPHIIGISGKMGAGKTTLAKALANNLDATLLAWDDFDEISISPNDYVDWFHRGEDYTEWNYEALAATLKSLKAGSAILHPVLNFVLQPRKFIVFDAPLGRLHPQTGCYIDTWIHITVPLDISLCRWLIRDFKNTSKSKEELISELEYYLSHSRPLFFDDKLKENADMVSDGMLSIDSQVNAIDKYFLENTP